MEAWFVFLFIQVKSVSLAVKAKASGHPSRMANLCPALTAKQPRISKKDERKTKEKVLVINELDVRFKPRIIHGIPCSQQYLIVFSLSIQ